MDKRFVIEPGKGKSEEPEEQPEEVVSAPEAEFEPEPDIPDETPQDQTEMESGEDWTPPAEKAPDPFGTPAAEDGKAEPVSEEQQYSETVGEGDINEEGPVSEMDELPDQDF